MGIYENGILDTVSATANAIGGMLYRGSDGSAEIKGLAIDSRKVKKDFVFFAIKGESLDGHAYIPQAIAAGASCIVCEKVPENLKCNFIVTDDTTYALGRLANAYKKIIGVKTVAVTGSVGKTTTKQFIYSVAREIAKTQKTEGNFNNEIGLPLTLLSLEKDTKQIILEAGMNHKGEMHRLSMIAEPDIACITNIGTAHIENLGSRENIAYEKLSVCDGMNKFGKAILNGDEPLLLGKENAVYVSAKGGGDVFASDIREYDDSIVFDMTCFGKKYKDVEIPTVGIHNVSNAMYAAAVGCMLGANEDDIRRGLLNFENTGMRQNMYEKDGIYIIEDCYNASAESMEASLRVLRRKADEHGGRAVAVLGDMKELGSFSRELHRRVGKAAFDNGIDFLFTYGTDSFETGEGFKAACAEKGIENIRLKVYNTECEGASPEDFAKRLKSSFKKGDTVLFKASRAMKLEEVIEKL